MFVQTFVEKQGKVDEIELEVEEVVKTSKQHLLTGSDQWEKDLANPITRLKVDKDGCVIVHFVEEKKFLEEDLEKAYNAGMNDQTHCESNMGPRGNFKKWFDNYIKTL